MVRLLVDIWPSQGPPDLGRSLLHECRSLPSTIALRRVTPTPRPRPIGPEFLGGRQQLLSMTRSLATRPLGVGVRGSPTRIWT